MAFVTAPVITITAMSVVPAIMTRAVILATPVIEVFSSVLYLLDLRHIGRCRNELIARHGRDR